MTNSQIVRKLNKRAANRRSLENGDLPWWVWVALAVGAIAVCTPSEAKKPLEITSKPLTFSETRIRSPWHPAKWRCTSTDLEEGTCGELNIGFGK